MGPISTAAEHLADSARHTASTTGGSLLDLGTQVIRLVNNLRETEARNIGMLLGRVGLQRRRSPFMPVLWAAAGAIVAGGAVFMLSPSGKSVIRRARGVEDKAGHTMGVPRPVANNAKSEIPR